MIFRHISLFFFNLFDKTLYFLSGYFILSQKPLLGLQLFIISTILSIGSLFKLTQFFLRIRHTNERTSLLDDNKPSPISERHELPELPLADLDKFSLVILSLINSSPKPLKHLTLKEANKLQYNVISLFFKKSKSTSSEEDKSVTKTISLTREINLIHESISGSF